MPTRADLHRSIADGSRAVNAVLRGFWQDVRRILDRWGDRPLDRVTRPVILRQIDTVIGRVFGTTRQAAQVSSLFSAIVSSTDAATARTMGRHVDRARRIAGPDLWRQVTTQPVGDDRFRRIVAALEGRLSPSAAQEVYRASALNPDRAWVEGSRKTLSDRVRKVGRKAKKAITDAVNRAKQAVDVLPGLRIPGSRSMPGDAGARTIVQTEVARVANEAERVMTRVMPSVGLRYVLSDHERKEDACDPRANEDRFGLGKGVFPPGEAPMPPVHPNCRCSVIDVPLDPEKVRSWLERKERGDTVAPDSRASSAAPEERAPLSPRSQNEQFRSASTQPESDTVPEWKPTMTADEAERWAQGSSIPNTTTHVTRDAAADRIRRDGFTLDRSEWGRLYGDGVYMGPDGETAKFYEDLFAMDGRQTTRLNLRARTRNTLKVDVAGTETKTEELQEVIGHIPGGQRKYEQQVETIKTRNARILEQVDAEEAAQPKRNPFAPVSMTEMSGPTFSRANRLEELGYVNNPNAHAINEIAEDAGYDSIWINRAVPNMRDDGLGGMGPSEIVVFDPKNVVVVEP